LFALGFWQLGQEIMADWITIDGSEGEGGGQILRTAIALSLVTGRPFRIERIRAGRKKPGLLRQHLTAVQAAIEMSGARASGAELGSHTMSFEPSHVRGGVYRLAVGNGRQRNAGLAGRASCPLDGARIFAAHVGGRNAQSVRATVRFSGEDIPAHPSPDGGVR
jgi:hypothetical protein